MEGALWSEGGVDVDSLKILAGAAVGRDLVGKRVQIIGDGGDAGLGLVGTIEPLGAARVEVERSRRGIRIVNAVGRRRCGVAVTVAEKDLIGKAERLAVWAGPAVDGLMIIVTHGVGISERLEKRSVAILNVEEGHGLTGVMRRASRRRAKGCGDRGLEIVETTGRVVLRYVFGIDCAIDLLNHLEILMDGVASVGVEGHGRASQLERSRGKVVDVGDAGIGTEGDAQARATGSEKELILGRQAEVTTGKGEDADCGGNLANAGEIRRRQRWVKSLVGHIGAAEEFAAVRRGRDLELVPLSKVGTWRTIGVDDALGEKIEHALSAMLWHVGGENMIETAIFANDDDDVFYGAGGFDAVTCPVGLIVAVANRNVSQHRKCECCCAYRCAQPRFPSLWISVGHVFSLEW